MSAATPWPVTLREPALDPALLGPAFEVCPEGLAVVEHGRILYANSSFAQAMGLAQTGTLRGRLLAEVAPEVPVETQTSSALFRSQGREITVVTAHRVLTNRTARNTTALETMGRLVSGVAHDFNNLLTGILLYCDLLIAALESDPRLQAQVREMRIAGEQGGALIQQLLTLARHQAAEPRPILWNDTIRGLRPFLERLIGENIELSAQLDPALEPVQMDPAQMQQTILNLVLNARDAMPEGGRVALATSNCKQNSLGRVVAVEFSVSDTGCGMDDETRARVFEPFFSTKAPGRGSGLGLATVHNIVAQHGGTIQVESAPGTGTRVVVRLPRLHRIHKSERRKKR